MIRILFVDDEINVLQAMRRTSHGMRSEWNMEFVASGAEDLEALAREPADVIVSDMRMSGMDGWEFLAEVKNRYPQTVRSCCLDMPTQRRSCARLVQHTNILPSLAKALR